MAIERTIEAVVDEVLQSKTSENPLRNYCIAFVTPFTHSEEKNFELLEVNLSDPEDEVGTFFSRQIKKIEGYIENPKTIPVNVLNAHGRPVSKRVQNEIRDHRVREYKFELAVFKGSIIAPITIENKRGGWDYTVSRS